jgi:hypothetical protein
VAAESSLTRTRSKIVFGTPGSDHHKRSPVAAPELSELDRAVPVFSSATRTQSNLFMGDAAPVLRSTAEMSYAPLPSDLRRGDLTAAPTCSNATRTQSNVPLHDAGGKSPALRTTSVSAAAFGSPTGALRTVPSKTAREVHLSFAYGPGGGPELYRSTARDDLAHVAAAAAAVAQSPVSTPRGAVPSPDSPGKMSPSDVAALRLKSHLPFVRGGATDTSDRYVSVSKQEYVRKERQPVVTLYSSANKTASRVTLGYEP